MTNEINKTCIDNNKNLHIYVSSNADSVILTSFKPIEEGVLNEIPLSIKAMQGLFEYIGIEAIEKILESMKNKREAGKR